MIVIFQRTGGDIFVVNERKRGLIKPVVLSFPVYSKRKCDDITVRDATKNKAVDQTKLIFSVKVVL